MSPVRWVLTGFGVVVALAIGVWWVRRDNRLREQGAIEVLIDQQRVKDSAMMAIVTQLSLKLDSTLERTGQATHTFTRVVEKVPVPGTIDSVFVDTAFANMPDSAKVELLRRLGLEVSNQCNALRQDCARFRDSVFRALRLKDSTITFWQRRYDSKGHRPCGFGIAGGATGVYDLSNKRFVGGPGATAGGSCTF